MPADRDGIEQIAHLHARFLFPGALAEMGESFVADVAYRALMEAGVLDVIALWSGARIVGYVGFTGDTRSYQRTGFVRKPFIVIAAAIKAVIGHPRRMRALLDLGRDAFGGDRPDDLEGTGEVVAIVVDNELLDHAGRDLSPQPAQLLLDAAIEGLRAEGVRRVRARVNADRRPALLLYARRPGVSYRDYRRRNEPMVEITLDI
ncbi:MAG TPA: hypothetical protein VIL12_07035 [Acidimicrobiia bacterium]